MPSTLQTTAYITVNLTDFPLNAVKGYQNTKLPNYENES